MIDVYGIIAVGSALIIGIIPITSKKFTKTDFLTRGGRRKLASSYGIASGKKIDICAETIDG